MQGYGTGDVLRLLLDSDAGTLTVKKNGTLLGVAVTSGLIDVAVAKAQGANDDVLTARCEERAQAVAAQEAAEAHLHRLHTDCVVLTRGESVYTDATRPSEIYTHS
jgi:hypothetical protein